MSVIVQSGEAICKSCWNNSKSKQMYSFGKQKRFPKEKLNRPSDEELNKMKNKDMYREFYDLPSTLSKQSCNFGLGNKYDFTKAQRWIKNQTYAYTSDFNANKPHGPAFSFGSHQGKEIDNRKKPVEPDDGPSYMPPKFGQGSIAYTIRGRPEIKKNDKIDPYEVRYPQPGPGQYKITIQISPTGRYPISTIPNSTSPNYSYKDYSNKERFKYGSKKNNYDIRYIYNILIHYMIYYID